MSAQRTVKFICGRSVFVFGQRESRLLFPRQVVRYAMGVSKKSGGRRAMWEEECISNADVAFVVVVVF